MKKNKFEFLALLRKLIRLETLVIVLSFLSFPLIVQAETPPEFAIAWGNELGVLHNPQGVAVDPSGNVYVADPYAHRVQKFTSDGLPVAQWLIQASGDGEYVYPYAIAVDANGNLYVGQYSFVMYGDGSYYGYRGFYFWSIQKYDSTGNFLFEWEVGDEFNGPSNIQGIAVDASGNVYVANGSIQKFDSNGTLLAQWEVSDYCGDVQNFYPGAITVDTSGNIYVAGGSCIQKYDSAGNYLSQWGSQGSGEGQFEFAYATAIATDTSGNVFVTDYYNYRIQKFTPDGLFIAQWGTSGSGEGEFNGLAGIAVDAAGNVFVTDYYNNRIQKFNSAGTFLAQWGNLSNEPGHFYKEIEEDIVNDASGNLYVVNYGNNHIQKYDNNGTFLTQWGTEGSGDGQFKYPTRITLDTSGNIFVVDSGNSRLQKFSSSGTYLSQLKLADPSTGQFWVPTDIAIDASGNIYAVDGNGHILKYDSTGNFVILWGTSGSWYPTDIATDKEGNVHVVDSYNLLIQKFDSNGAYLTQWGGFGYEAGLFFREIRIAIDADDNVYASDGGNHRIQKFNSAGTFLSEWGDVGSGDGQFVVPTAISTDTQGSVYAYDRGNYRIQKFTYLAPAQPTSLTASAASTTGISLSWTDASDNETGFIIERCKGAGCSAFAVLATVTANTTTYSDTGLTAGTSYSYRVRATNNGSKSAYSNTATTTTLTATPPSAPKTLTAATGSGNQVNLSWSDQSNNETGFKIERCTGSTCTNFSQIATVGQNVISWTDTTVTSGSTYRYRVRAYNSYGNSAYSNIVSITVSGSTSLPTAPSNLTATAQSTTQIKLAWTDNSTNETQFKIERCQGATCSNFAQIKAVSANTTTTTDSNLRSKTTYRYRVRASNTGGNSVYSNTVSATTK